MCLVERLRQPLERAPSRFDLVRAGVELGPLGVGHTFRVLERCFERLDAGVAQGERQSHRVRIVGRGRGGIADERRAVLYRVVLHVPTARALVRQETSLPFLEHFARAVRLAANGIVARNEPQREGPPAWELRFVAAARYQIDSRARLLPAANLQTIVRRALLVMRERLADVVARAES